MNIKKQGLPPVSLQISLVIELILARLGMEIKEGGNHSCSENAFYSLGKIWWKR